MKKGKLLIVGTPGKGLAAKYENEIGAVVDVPIESPGTDWGYSCYFEFTVKDTRGEWVGLPRRPFPQAVYFNIKNDWLPRSGNDVSARIRSLNHETVYLIPRIGNVVVTKFIGDQFKYRRENANDMLCGEERKKIPTHD